MSPPDHTPGAAPGAIPTLPPLREVIAAHGLAAKKALGQNFILDLNLTARIVRAAGDLTGVQVIEIGPGPGGLTRALLASPAAQVTAIERDPRCLGALAELGYAYPGRLRVVEGDAREVNPAALVPAPRAIIANLPYHVATELLIGWLHGIEHLTSLTLMFQLEVAERIVAKPGTKDYGRLAVITQALTRAKIALTLPPAAFTPPPSVRSAVVHFTPLADRPAPDVVRALEQLTAAGFGQRRKMLKTSLKPVLPDTEATLVAAGLTPTDRAESLPLRGWIALAEVLAAAPS